MKTAQLVCLRVKLHLRNNFCECIHTLADGTSKVCADRQAKGDDEKVSSGTESEIVGSGLITVRESFMDYKNDFCAE